MNDDLKTANATMHRTQLTETNVADRFTDTNHGFS